MILHSFSRRVTLPGVYVCVWVRPTPQCRFGSLVFPVVDYSKYSLQVPVIHYGLHVLFLLSMNQPLTPFYLFSPARIYYPSSKHYSHKTLHISPLFHFSSRHSFSFFFLFFVFALLYVLLCFLGNFSRTAASLSFVQIILPLIFSLSVFIYLLSGVFF